jgi:ribonuclease HI
MNASEEVTIYTDGAARGNPGPAAFAYVLLRQGGDDVEEKGRLGDTTNNIAEYTALVRALQHALRLGARRVRVFSDSELMVRQMAGEYQVKNEGLRPLYEEASALRRRFDAVNIQHVRRAENSRADRLCNEALDGDRAASPKPAARSKAGKPRKTPGPRPDVKERALDCLHTVAAAWARGDPADPRPEDVWEQLWSILAEGGALRQPRSRSSAG